jgi:hypothetical protein
VQDGKIAIATPDDQVDILLELGALDVKEKISTGKYMVVLLTEDSVIQYLNVILRNSGFNLQESTILSYNGVTSVHLLKPLVKQIKDISKAAILVHRDRDFLDDDETEDWKRQIRAIGAEPFVTAEIDIEGYFCSDEYISFVVAGHKIDIDDIKKAVVHEQIGEIISSYVNGRIDNARKNGTIGKLDVGKLSAIAAKSVADDPWKFMKGKRKLARLRYVCQEIFHIKFEIDFSSHMPTDKGLMQIATKSFKKSSK